jgi:hypothetical protein
MDVERVGHWVALMAVEMVARWDTNTVDMMATKKGDEMAVS